MVVVVVITCVGIIITMHPSTVPFGPPPRLQPKPEASKVGFTQQSSSRENGCCFQVLFAHLSGVDCSGENGVRGMQGFFFNIVLFQPACVGDACVFFFAVLLLLFFYSQMLMFRKHLIGFLVRFSQEKI